MYGSYKMIKKYQCIDVNRIWLERDRIQKHRWCDIIVGNADGPNMIVSYDTIANNLFTFIRKIVNH